MATITITIPAAVVNRVQDAIASKYGYTGFLADGVTPQTKAEFAKARIIVFLKNTVMDYESQQAATTAAAAQIINVETNVILT